MGSQQLYRSQFWAQQQQQQLVVFKQGELIKQSKHLKQWRNRTVILIAGFIVTLQNDQQPPTAVIPLANLRSLVKDEDNPYFLIKLVTKTQEEFRFRTRQQQERDEWFDRIKAEKVRILKESKVNSSIVEQQHNCLTFVQEQEVSVGR